MTRDNSDEPILPYGPAEAGLFDEDIVQEVVSFIGRDTYRRLLDEFCQSLPEKLEALQSLLGNPDDPGEAAARTAHQLKGAAQALGLTRLAQSMAAIAAPQHGMVDQKAAEAALRELRETIGLLLRSQSQPEASEAS